MFEKRGRLGEQFIHGGYMDTEGVVRGGEEVGGQRWDWVWALERRSGKVRMMHWQGGAAEGCHIPRREEQLVQGNVWLNSKDVPKPACEWLQMGEF